MRTTRFEQCIARLGGFMTGGNTAAFTPTNGATATAALNPREVELLRVFGAVFESCAPRLICPDDEGMIRATQGTGQVRFIIAANAPSAEVTLPVLGLDYCLSIGLALGTLATTDWGLEIIRAGTTVASLNSTTFNPETANPRAGACVEICVGAIQSVTLRVVNLGAAWLAADTLSMQIYRNFDCDSVSGTRIEMANCNTNSSAGCKNGC
jgi:hypothetical protein